MTWDRRDLNPWLGLVLDSVGEQFGVPFPPPTVRGTFSLDTAEELGSVLSNGGLQDVAVEVFFGKDHPVDSSEQTFSA